MNEKESSSQHYKLRLPLYLGIAVTPVLVVLAAVSGGVGHGSYLPAIITIQALHWDRRASRLIVPVEGLSGSADCADKRGMYDVAELQRSKAGKELLFSVAPGKEQ